MEQRFEDRTDAGRRLADRLRGRSDLDDAVVLALPRGGVVVGYEIAAALGLPLDVLVVRKLGLPEQPELAMGAIASGGVQVRNEDVLLWLGVSDEVVEQVAAREREELERRERAYRGGRPLVGLKGRPVILVDDGVATGSTIRAAIGALRALDVGRVVVAAPVAAPDVVATLAREADEVVCLSTPDPMYAIGMWYDRFLQTTDDEVTELLRRAARTTRPT